MNPPTAPYPCTLQGPSWSWVVGKVEQSSNPNGPWTAASSGYSIWINQPSSSSPNATIYATFSVAAFWRFTAIATATYTDSPCTDIWSASGETGYIYVTAVDVSFSPDPVFVCACSSCSPASLTATVTPSAAASLVSFTTANSSVATVSGTAPNLSVTGVGTGTTQVQAQLSGRTGKTVTVYVGRAYFTPYRAGDYFGQAVSDTVKQSGDPTKYVVLINNAEEASTRAVARAKIVLKAVNPAPGEGVLAITLSNSSSVKLYQSDGTTALTDMSVDFASPSGYLAGLTSGDVTIWLEGVNTDSDFVFGLEYRKPDGTTVCRDQVHILIPLYTLRGYSGSVIYNVSTVPMDDLLILGGVTPLASKVSGDKPTRDDPPSILNSAYYKIEIDSLPTSAVTSLQVQSTTNSDSYTDTFASGSSVVSANFGVVYDPLGSSIIARPSQTGTIMSNLSLNVIPRGGNQVVLTTVLDKYTRVLSTVFATPQSTVLTSIWGGIAFSSGTSIVLSSSSSGPSGGSSSWTVTAFDTEANITTSGGTTATYTINTDAYYLYTVSLTYTYTSVVSGAVTTTQARKLVYVVPPTAHNADSQ
jgi:hypothetical protein